MHFIEIVNVLLREMIHWIFLMMIMVRHVFVGCLVYTLDILKIDDKFLYPLIRKCLLNFFKCLSIFKLRKLANHRVLFLDFVIHR